MAPVWVQQVQQHNTSCSYITLPIRHQCWWGVWHDVLELLSCRRCWYWCHSAVKVACVCRAVPCRAVLRLVWGLWGGHCGVKGRWGREGKKTGEGREKLKWGKKRIIGKWRGNEEGGNMVKKTEEQEGESRWQKRKKRGAFEREVGGGSWGGTAGGHIDHGNHEWALTLYDNSAHVTSSDCTDWHQCFNWNVWVNFVSKLYIELLAGTGLRSPWPLTGLNCKRWMDGWVDRRMVPLNIIVNLYPAEKMTGHRNGHYE